MIVYVGNDIERALVELRKKLNTDGLLRELKSKRFFLSRSERRRVKDRESNADTGSRRRGSPCSM
jgi:ribosomal protein S21